MAADDADGLPTHLSSLLRIPKSPRKAPLEAEEASGLTEVERIRRGLASLISQGEDGISLHISFRSNQPTLNYRSRECAPEAAEYTAQNLVQSGVPLWYALLLARKIGSEMYPPLPRTSSLQEDSDTDDEVNGGTPTSSPVRNNIPKRADALLATFVEELLQQTDDELLREKPLSAFPYSIYAAKNMRRKMEDRHVIIPRLGLIYPDAGHPDDAVYAVFDGHGGAEVAGYLATHFLDHLVQTPSFSTSPADALKEAFVSCDAAVIRRSQKTNYRGGCTAVVAIVRDVQVSVAWAGDSQAAILRFDGGSRLLTDPIHSPNCRSEYERIEAAGGVVVSVEGELRVQGCLNLTRSFGDVALKPDIVTAEADTAVAVLGDGDLALVLGCDGLWDHISLDEATQAIRQYVKENGPHEYSGLGRSLGEAAKRNESSDNITAVVVLLCPPEEFWRRVAEVPDPAD